MNAFFADTFYFIAALNPYDQAHHRVLDFSRSHRGTIVTTSWVLMEIANTFAKVVQRRGVVCLLQELVKNPKIRIIPADQQGFDLGFKLYSERLDKDWSLTDCISFVVMREEGLTVALTGDHHFEQAGFTALFMPSKR